MNLVVPLVCLCFAHMTDSHVSSDSAFTLISGVSSSKEQCLVVHGGNIGEEGALIGLEDCYSAIQSGDGRSEWIIDSDGMLKLAVADQCTAVVNGKFILSKCSGQSVKSLDLNGQFRLLHDGNEVCLTQSGIRAGDEDVAFSSAIEATSSISVSKKGIHNVVDGDETTFWMADPASSVEIVTLDFGQSYNIKKFEIVWEAPALDFSIQFSDNGHDWVTMWSTDVNSLFMTSGYLGYAAASHARIVMNSLHPVFGAQNGFSSYAIRSIQFIAPMLKTVVTDCDTATKNTDARDKYFVSYVSGSDLLPSKQNARVRDQLHSAFVDLEAVSSKLSKTIAGATKCSKHPISFLQTTVSSMTVQNDNTHMYSESVSSARKIISSARELLSQR